jgi:hypothetical protein
MNVDREKILYNSSQRDITKDRQVWLKPVKILHQLVVLKEYWCMNFSRTLIEEADCQTQACQLYFRFTRMCVAILESGKE